MLPSTLYIMSPMYMQRLNLLCPKVKEVMHSQENTLHNTQKMLPSTLPYTSYDLWTVDFEKDTILTP